jgi:integrase
VRSIKNSETASTKEAQASELEGIAGHDGSGVRGKSAGKVQESSKAPSKGDSRYWLRRDKLTKRKSANYGFQVQFKGQRLTFSTRTGNKEAAAKIAAGIYRDLVDLGSDKTLAKHRPQTEKADKTATVGEWIKGALKVSEASQGTLTDYARSLRKIVGDMLAVKRSKKRFGPKKGGAAKYRQEIDDASLDLLTPGAVQQWRLAYVAKSKTPADERSRKTTCNSCVRKACSLFAPKIVKFLPELRLPTPTPFADVEFFPRQSSKYFSRIDAKALLQKAGAELAEEDPPAFLTMLLVLSAGLRRQEVDSLCWHQVDFTRQLIRIEATDKASLKTTDSRGEVAIDETITAILRGFFAKVNDATAYVIEGSGKAHGPQVWGRHYRADDAFSRLIAWLRANGVKARKPIHELRKELGALVTAEHGIYAASRVLRHSNVSTTASHYTDLKTRPVVNVGVWLTEGKGVIQMPQPERPARSKRKKAAGN